MFSRISRLETMPVFRHGSEAARICDEALSVSGPTDPRIAKIIQTDQNAQMAYHIHKALGFALEVKTTVIEYWFFCLIKFASFNEYIISVCFDVKLH